MQTMNIAVAIPVPETITIIVLGDVFHSMLAGPAAEVTLVALKQAVAKLESQLTPATPPAPAVDAAPALPESPPNEEPAT
ncbi:MAG: hypothetical protein H0X24_19405 [Ktedonobacterales bacterium]|nr:hypothetical protein [Ktedonobacterales bacterium]